MVKAIKVMLIPNNVQKTKMFQYAGASRFAYNWALAREKENYEKGGKFISDSEMCIRDSVPNCMRPVINKKLKLMSELTEHTLANEIEAPHEILRK